GLLIGNNRMAHCFGMGAQLMGAPGHRLERKPSEPGRPFIDGLVRGHRMRGAGVAMPRDPHFLKLCALLSAPPLKAAFLHPIAFCEVEGNAALRWLRHTLDDRPIDLRCLTGTENFTKLRGNF